ncbi:hypothetical protein [Helicobacter sp. 12S02634-8]|uniref:hypothetical protein n=1 Tax=Helicobacter sp. 12S02634-8 TaxID=1476199 RepID=UPI00117AEDCE|nr:hypothetical protein [Helicobacter sp. 12S02634-8]
MKKSSYTNAYNAPKTAENTTIPNTADTQVKNTQNSINTSHANTLNASASLTMAPPLTANL